MLVTRLLGILVLWLVAAAVAAEGRAGAAIFLVLVSATLLVPVEAREDD